MTIGRRFINYSEKQMQKWMRWSLTMFRKYRLQYMRVGYFHQLSGNTNPKNTHSIIEATAKSGPWRLCTPKKHIFHIRGSWKSRVAHGSKMSENSNVMKPKYAKLVIFKKGVFLKCMFLMGFRKSSASTFWARRRMPGHHPWKSTYPWKMLFPNFNYAFTFLESKNEIPNNFGRSSEHS